MNILFMCGREPSYARNKVILDSLKYNKYKVIDCTSSYKNPIIRHTIVFLKFLKNKNKADIFFIGFIGHHLVPLVKLFTKKPIIFDAFLSAYDTLIYDRKRFKKNSIISKIIYNVEKKSYNLANKIIIDTNQHINYIVKTFNISKDKLYKIPVGADEKVFYPKNIKNKKFIVLFYGNFMPLHGVSHIIKAANVLKKHKDILFIIIGRGQTYNNCLKLVKKLKVNNIIFKKNMSIEEIASHIAKCNVGLGIFGNTNKAKRVIPNKVYQILAMKKPVITLNTPASKELLIDYKNVIFCEQDSLANKILELKNNKELIKKISENGYKTFKKECSLPIIAKQIKKIIEN